MPAHDQDTLEGLLATARERYDVIFEKVTVGKYELEILQLSDMMVHIDDLAEQANDETRLELPFWARIWPSSILLSYYIQRMDPAAGVSMLEIGGGIGVCGLFAARHGFKVTISDINEDALLFARINVLKNGLQDRAQVCKVDFTKATMPQTYNYILGSEVIYLEDTYRSLVKFFLKTLDPGPGSEIILAKSYNLKTKRFFALAEQEFVIKMSTIGYKEKGASGPEGEKHLAQIVRMRSKKICSC
jgi:2-polyprenyl-3-methyl-5-hydroxy-6-metoxy-1,4-benzoquinol methylase